VTTDKCQLLLKSCYSVGYNYHIYHWILTIAVLGVNNVPNYLSNNHDLSLDVRDLCWLADGGI